MLRRIFNVLSNTPGSPTQPALAAATVDAYVDTVSGSARGANPVADLVARAQACATLVEQTPAAFSPAHLAHTVAAVVKSLTQMGEVTSDYVIQHWSAIGAEYAEPATCHLQQALKSLALTAGLLDVAVPAPASLHQGNALTALQQAATTCVKQLCTDEGAPVADPAEVARAIAQTLAALAPIFGQVQAWINRHVPGRGRELPETARHHLHQAIGGWAPLAGLITHVPADPREPDPTPESGAESDSEAEVAVETSSEAVEAPTAVDTPEVAEVQEDLEEEAAPSRAKKVNKKATKKRR